MEFAVPSQQTEVIVLYYDAALYVGARLFDSAPDSILARLVRRDVDTESDLLGVFLLIRITIIAAETTSA